MNKELMKKGDVRITTEYHRNYYYAIVEMKGGFNAACSYSSRMYKSKDRGDVCKKARDGIRAMLNRYPNCGFKPTKEGSTLVDKTGAFKISDFIVTVKTLDRFNQRR